MAKSALVIVDVQNDFCEGGALPVPGGDAVVPVFNEYIHLFDQAEFPVYATRDWHPERSHHFRQYGGLWPPHCVQHTSGADFHRDLQLPDDVEIISAGVRVNEEGYSSFEGHNDEGEEFSTTLRECGVTHIYIGGLATDYCVRSTALDAVAEGYEVTLLTDAIRGIDVSPGDSEKAIDEMLQSGVKPATLEEVKEELRSQVHV